MPLQRGVVTSSAGRYSGMGGKVTAPHPVAKRLVVCACGEETARLDGGRAAARPTGDRSPDVRGWRLTASYALSDVRA